MISSNRKSVLVISTVSYKSQFLSNIDALKTLIRKGFKKLTYLMEKDSEGKNVNKLTVEIPL